MKTLIAATVLAASFATMSAATGTIDWTGSTGTLTSTCDINETVSGTMSYDEANGYFISTNMTASQVSVTVDRIASVSVVATQALKDASYNTLASADVAYFGDVFVTRPASSVLNNSIATGEAQVNNLGGASEVLGLSIKGTATPNASYYIPDNTAFVVQHTITCINQ